MEKMNQLQNLFATLRSQIDQNEFSLTTYSELAELMLDVVNGNESRSAMLKLAATLSNASSFDTLMRIMTISNELFIQAINGQNDERIINENSKVITEPPA